MNLNHIDHRRCLEVLAPWGSGSKKLVALSFQTLWKALSRVILFDASKQLVERFEKLGSDYHRVFALPYAVYCRFSSGFVAYDDGRPAGRLNMVVGLLSCFSQWSRYLVWSRCLSSRQVLE